LAGLAAVVMAAMVRADTAIAIPTLFDNALVFAGIESLPPKDSGQFHRNSIGLGPEGQNRKVPWRRQNLDVPTGLVDDLAANQQYGHSELKVLA
jgi:hypothetical protein